jgi:hypothetical protein
MFWKKLWKFLKMVWQEITGRKTSSKRNTLLDTVSVKLFGLELKVTREIPVDVPYELTVVVPRAEFHSDKKSGNREIILNSITIAHSPRFNSEPEKPVVPKPVAA